MIMKTNIFTNNTIMKTLRYICLVLMIIGTSAHAWGTTETLNFAKCDWGFSTSDYEWNYYSSDGYAIEAYAVKMQYYGGNYNGIMIDREGGYIILPPISGTISRIDVTATSGASVNANISLYVNGVIVGSAHNIGNTSTYWSSLNIASGAVVKLQNDDSKKGERTQIASVTITHNGSQQGGTSIPTSNYGISCRANPAGAGTVSASATYAQAWDEITLTSSPASGYTFDHWEVTYTTSCSSPTDLGNAYWFDDNSFYMPGGKVTVVGHFIESACTTPTVAFTNAGPYNKTYGDSGFTNAATVKVGTTPTGQTISYSSNNTSVASVNGSGAITLGNAGTAIITASVEDNGTYCQASATYTINVAAVAPTLKHDASGKELTTSAITSSGVIVSGGIITSKGGANITKYGFVIGTSSGVTYETATKKGGWDGDKTLNTAFGNAPFTGLNANTTYYVRAFAYNGTAYGYSTAISFKTLQSYTVTHAKNDGSGTTVTTNKDAGSSINVGDGITWTRDGYTLSNWRLNNASSGTTYATGASYTVNANATFHAQWSAISYSVRFNANGGTGSMSNQNFTYDVAQNLTSNAFTRSGYDFEGWATSENGAVVYTNEQNVSNLSSTNGDIVDLYAKWSAHEISLTLDANGGDSNGSAKVMYGATGLKDGTLSHAAWAGHTLDGYYAEAAHTTKVLNSNGSFAGTSVSGYITDGKWSRDAATTLYAFWAANPQTVTFDLDGKGANFTSVVDNGEKVSRPNPDPMNIDYNFDDWYTDDGNGNATNTKYNFNTAVTADITIHAKWIAKEYENLIFTCVEIDLDTEDGEPVLVTSRNGVNIMATKKLSLTVAGAFAGHRVTIEGTDLKFYKKIEGTDGNAGKFKYVELTGTNSFVAPLTDQEVYVSYNPPASPVGTGAVATPSITVKCDAFTKTVADLVKARNLPDQVAIVARVGNTWHALPANMTNEQTPAPVMVSAEVEDGILTAYGPSTISYKLWPVATVGGTTDRFGTAASTNFPRALYGDRLRFAGNSNKALWANNSTSNNGIKNYAAITAVNTLMADTIAYEWIVTTTEDANGEFVYTLQTQQPNNTNNLRLWGKKWGTYASNHGTAEVYILPLIPTDPADVTVMEWGTNELAVKYENASTVAANTFKAKIGTGSKTAVTCTPLGGDIYKLTGVGALQNNPAQTLVLNMTETSTPKQAVFAIPLIVTAEKTEAEISSYAAGGNGSTLINEGRAIAKGIDVIIRNGGTLTTGTTQGKFADLYLYPGGKADISQNIGFDNIYLRGGFSWLEGTSKDYRLPQMKVADEVAIDGVQHEGHGIYYDLYLDKRRYYMMAVPKDVALESITNEEDGDSFVAWVKQYSGRGRTLNPKQSGWTSTITNNTLYRGVGYEMSIKPRVDGRIIGILRMPLLQGTAWTNEGSCTPTVKAWGYNDDNVTDNNKGWNFLGNPYFTAFRNTAADGTVMEVCTLDSVFDDNGNWTGKWEMSESKVKYVTIPQKMYDDYYDIRALNYELDPFYPFFIQAKADGNLTFIGSPVIKAKPSLYRTAVEEREVIVDFELTSPDGVTDKAGLNISNEYAEIFDMEDKEKTIVNNNYLKVYTLVGEYRTAYNSLPEAAAAQPIPVGYIAPKAGEYTFSLPEDGDYSQVDKVLLTDYETSAMVNLLAENYTFETTAGEFNERLALNVILKSHNTATDMDNLSEDDDQPRKFIYQDKMYIMYRGVIYDAVGKKVMEVNK